MAKIMIVEDDRNLQSIYGDRLKAEGHTIIVASDGEEALAVAVKEKPDLIISDVMMPKISGFDMLDILRTTPETRNVKIIMMTALSQAEDRERANKLGADRYLVKSQVTLDDVARTVNEIVGGLASAAKTSERSAPISVPVITEPPKATPDPVIDNSTVVVGPPNATQPPVQTAETVDEEQAKISSQIDDFLNKNMPDTPIPATPQEDPTTFHPPIDSTESIAETNQIKSKSNIFDLYEKELAKEASQAEAPKAPDASPKT
ncbi:MAG: response regulator [Patescibacteria group bacterium]